MARGAFAYLKSYLCRRRAKKASRDILKVLQAFDDAIARAKLKHRPTSCLLAAKGDFLRHARP